MFCSLAYHPALPVYPIKTSLLEARVVTAGKGGEGGKVLDNLKREIDQSWPGEAGGPQLPT